MEAEHLGFKAASLHKTCGAKLPAVFCSDSLLYACFDLPHAA